MVNLVFKACLNCIDWLSSSMDCRSDPPVAAVNDNELFLDISQTVELPFQQDLSFTVGEGIKSGEKVLNCGLPVSCETNQFAVHLFSGKDNQIYPRLCIDGK